MRASVVIIGTSLMFGVCMWWQGKAAPILNYADMTNSGHNYILSCLVSAGFGNCPDLWPAGLGFYNLLGTVIFYAALAIIIYGLLVSSDSSRTPPGYNG